MGFFDTMANAMLNKMAGDKGPMVQMALQMMQEHGGLNGILGKFEDAGYRQQVASWISTGPNLPLEAQQVVSVLGTDAMQNMATRLDLSEEHLAQKIAEYLPMVIDRVSPQGSLSSNPKDILAILMAMK